MCPPPRNCRVLFIQFRGFTHFSFPGGIVSYGCPPPDLPGSANITIGNRDLWWDERDSRALVDGDYGKEVMDMEEVPSYGNPLEIVIGRFAFMM